MAGTYSVVALPANMAVMPMVGPITGICTAMLAVTWIYQPAAALIAKVAEPVINLPPYILKWLSNLPFASVTGNLAIVILVATTLAALVLTWLWCRKAGDSANLDLRP
jgi:competence protein ComEC